MNNFAGFDFWFEALLTRLGKTDSASMLLFAYRSAVRQLSPEEAEFAAYRAFMSCRFMPSPEELLSFVLLPVEEAAERAWAELIDGLSRGLRISPAIAASLKSLGIAADTLAQLPAERSLFVRKMFCDTFAKVAQLPEGMRRPEVSEEIAQRIGAIRSARLEIQPQIDPVGASLGAANNANNRLLAIAGGRING